MSQRWTRGSGKLQLRVRRSDDYNGCREIARGLSRRCAGAPPALCHDLWCEERLCLSLFLSSPLAAPPVWRRARCAPSTWPAARCCWSIWRGTCYVVDDTCTHEDCSLGEGYFDDGVVE